MTQQTVFRLPSKGSGVDSLRITQEPIPQPAPHEVVLQIHASTLNYRDLIIATGSYPFPAKDDVVPASDGAGIIHAVGAQVPASLSLQKGDWAIANFDITNLYGPQQDWEHGLGGPLDGMLREYIAVPAAAVVAIPRAAAIRAGFSFAQLAALVCTGTTAWNALYGNAPLKPGQTVLLQGTGGVAMTALMLARAAGAVTIITSSSDEKLQLAREKYGVDHAINYTTTPHWAAEALRLTGGRGVDFVLENGGAGTIAQSIECIRPGGIISVIGFVAPPPEEGMPDVATLVLGKGCVVRGINVGAKQLTEDLVRFVCERGLQMPVERTFGFTRDEVLAAYRLLESGGHVGKIAIEIRK